MSEKLVLSYQRRKELENDEHLHDGTIELFNEQPWSTSAFRDSGDVAYPEPKVWTLSGATFVQVMTLFSEVAGMFPESKLYVQKRELGTPPVQLSDELERWLRTDPVGYIKEMSPPARRIVIRLKDDSGMTRNDSTPPIRAGHASLAEAFGDFVYLRVRELPGVTAECPFCGRWQAKPSEGVLQCSYCAFNVSAERSEDGSWFKVSTQELLDAGRFVVPRLYIPRAWNVPGPWVGYEELKVKYMAFLKEKESCFRIKDEDKA